MTQVLSQRSNPTEDKTLDAALSSLRSTAKHIDTRVVRGRIHDTLKPALTLSHVVVSWLNDCVSPRAPFQCRLGDEPLSVRTEGLVWLRKRSATPMMECIWRVGDETIVLTMSRGLIEALISTVQSSIALPSEPSGSFVLELALEPLVAKLEAQTQQNVQLIQLREATTPPPYIEFDVAFGLVKGQARLCLFSPLDGGVPSVFHALGKLLRRLPPQPREFPPELPVIVAAKIGSLCVSAALLRDISAGDALIPEVLPFRRNQIILSAGRLWAVADVADDQLILRRPFNPQPCPLEYVHMMTEPEWPQGLSDTELDNVEITLIFECGRWSMPLGELRNAGEGHVFELGRPIDGPIDIVANGRRIGRGDIVRIGDELGIRLRGRLACNE
ncbi:type III secretion system cytoplasmic ring protein SctQ [Rhizobium etli]|uniref:type III secretion system cytoplasmic ring protein SctQ n=1 Tax=Rhizobium etli TaxID=29449 RepID=UPI0003839841|nr:type III secretion system cytoplasmic ring protein SctQ [Rhizobium etli]AGS25371.1 type III secretion system YscQ/HrcQ family protein [Rhizobium etli bv. mimosae str. Mim1]